MKSQYLRMLGVLIILFLTETSIIAAQEDCERLATESPWQVIEDEEASVPAEQNNGSLSRDEYTEENEELRTSEDWYHAGTLNENRNGQVFQIILIDPDGWRHQEEPSINWTTTLISEQMFRSLAMRSSLLSRRMTPTLSLEKNRCQ